MTPYQLSWFFCSLVLLSLKPVCYWCHCFLLVSMCHRQFCFPQLVIDCCIVLASLSPQLNVPALFIQAPCVYCPSWTFANENLQLNFVAGDTVTNAPGLKLLQFLSLCMSLILRSKKMEKKHFDECLYLLVCFDMIIPTFKNLISETCTPF